MGKLSLQFDSPAVDDKLGRGGDALDDQILCRSYEVIKHILHWRERTAVENRRIDTSHAGECGVKGEMKRQYTCFLCLVPALCHSSPYSPPPRMFATTYT